MSATHSSSPLPAFSSGIPALDELLSGFLPGDNVVWQVDNIDDYQHFVDPFVRWGVATGTPLVYFRFASHAPLVAEQQGVRICHVDPSEGFERFVGELLTIIEETGRGSLYVFDGLSDLAADWYSDRMLGNFFMITCPFLFSLDTIAYFGLFKRHHSANATESIQQTAQVVMDVYRSRKRLFVQPVKVEHRYSPRMFQMHVWDAGRFLPVTASTTIAEVLADTPQPWLDFASARPGIWRKTVTHAQKALEDQAVGTGNPEDIRESFQRLMRSAITRNERMIPLAEQYFTLSNLLDVIQRMIGTGLVGGKTLGVLLARAIIRNNAPDLSSRLEPHDSFFIGSDVYYTYLVKNGCWEMRRKANDLDYLMSNTDSIQRIILSGSFPEAIQGQFREMLDYFGQSPIIVRSSSLLEDSYGNAFSGKYDTVFCANQGTPNERLGAFMDAVRTVYASTLSPEALSYRAQRGLLDLDEQMSLLVQRVSGDLYGEDYFPQVAGVGFSFNPYVWNEDIDPAAGMLRLVFGLGTRAVDRTGDDYTRLIALNAPERRPEPAAADLRRYSQRQVDVLDLSRNTLTAKPFETIAAGAGEDLPMDLFAGHDNTYDAGVAQYLTFDRLIGDTGFVQDMRDMLAVLQQAYQYPVDIEFTANFTHDGDYRINLVQCRPFQVRIADNAAITTTHESIDPDAILMESAGPIIGQSTVVTIDRLIYVVPAIYGALTMSERYTVARTIGKLNRLTAAGPKRTLMLAGPGRCATSIPALGVPVTFAEINAATVVCEIAAMHAGLVPDISLGTHFFNDLVELDMLYLAVSPDKDGHQLQSDRITALPNKLVELLPEAEKLADVLHVVDSADLPKGNRILLSADCLKQRAVMSVGKLKSL